MIPFFDSHAHLADAAFDADRDSVVEKAAAAGAVGIVCIGESRAAADGAARLATRHPGLVYATAGVHPHDAGDYDHARDGLWIRNAIATGAVAIGECGLDYHYDHSPRAAQRDVFRDQLELAASTGRPVIVHTREAEDDTRALILDAAATGVLGVLHCYTGSRALAEDAVRVGWYVSFSGIVTFKKWNGDDVIRAIPDDRILVETDAPYLAPVPMRGKRNEPRFVPAILERIAGVRETDPATLAAQTIANTRRFFGVATVGVR